MKSEHVVMTGAFSQTLLTDLKEKKGKKSKSLIGGEMRRVICIVPAILLPNTSPVYVDFLGEQWPPTPLY